jgi:hypothetical protein
MEKKLANLHCSCSALWDNVNDGIYFFKFSLSYNFWFIFTFKIISYVGNLVHVWENKYIFCLATVFGTQL